MNPHVASGGGPDQCQHTAELRIFLSRPGQQPSTAALRHVDGGLVLEVHDISALAGIAHDPEWRARAAALAERGRSVRVMHDGLLLLVLGAHPAGGETLSDHMHLGTWPPAAKLLGIAAGPSADAATS